MDSNIFSYVIAAVAVCSVVVILMVITGSKKTETGKKAGSTPAKKKTNKSQSQIIKEASRRLAKNPDDPDGLLALGDIYFSSQLWEKALPIYQSLTRIAQNAPDIINIGLIKTRAGICSYNLGNYSGALAYFNEAYSVTPHNFEVNFYMGCAYYKNDQADKAIPCLKKALMINNAAEGVHLILGQCLYKTNHYRESLPYFKKVLAEDPSNKEALFSLADAMTEDGHADKAMKVFMHLRPDPVYGARSCLRIGVHLFNQGDKENAAQNLQIGLKHTNADPEILIEIKYRLALCCFELNKFPAGLELLRQIRTVNENYKDVNSLIARYQELSQNSNLQVYLSGSVGDFVALCRKIVNSFYKNANVKIQDIKVGSAYTDIITEISTPRYDNIEIFRFFRTTGATGEFYVREFHDSLHDMKADRGYCITAGSFSDESHKFIEGRPVDLIEKTQLSKILKHITA